MADELTPGHVRARRFDVARRGYDRAQVEQYLAEVADQLSDIESRLALGAREDVGLGLSEHEALGRELGRVGADVAEILEAARSAAERMRTRAEADAEEWRSSAREDAAAIDADAHEASQALRSAAWTDGTNLLSSAKTASETIITQAKEDALFVRAESEREALRLTSDAKRDREESLRVARMEAEALIENARAESEGMLAAAQQQADLAQERARALEDRRSELLAELEATRAKISDLEAEIDSRRQEMVEEEQEPEPEPDERTHHTGDSGSVRIVAPSKVVELRPVDTDELVAEVAAMRSKEASLPPTGTDEAVETGEPPDLVAVPEPEPEPEPTGELEVVAGEPEEPSVKEADRGEESVTEAAAKSTDEIGSLFAKLRDESTEARESKEPEPEPDPDPVSEALPADEDESEIDEDAAPPIEATREPEVGPASDVPSATDHNSALRTIKRSLVELQNETLEHLRTDKKWIPPTGYTERFGPAFDGLAKSVGATSGKGAAKTFSTDLLSEVTDAIERARSHGAGDREVAAAASKVFRLWRSDEAERRTLEVTRELASH